MNEEIKSLVPIKNESGSSIEGPNNSHSPQQERQDSGQFYNISIYSKNIGQHAPNKVSLSHEIEAKERNSKIKFKKIYPYSSNQVFINKKD